MRQDLPRVSQQGEVNEIAKTVENLDITRFLDMLESGAINSAMSQRQHWSQTTVTLELSLPNLKHCCS